MTEAVTTAGKDIRHVDTLVTTIIASLQHWIERVMINDINIDTIKELIKKFLLLGIRN